MVYVESTALLQDTPKCQMLISCTNFEYFPYSDEILPDYQEIKLPFAESEMIMILALQGTDSADPLQALFGHEPVALAIPKFKFESQ